jgi:DNA-binding MarR family transcriptional regulator
MPFTADDLLRTRFAAEPAPLLELTLALAALQRRDPLFERWRRRAHAALPRAAAPMLELVRPSADCPYFLHPISDGVEDGLATVLSTPQPVVDRELDQLIAAGRASCFIRDLRSRDRRAWTELTEAARSAYRALLGDHWLRVRAGHHAEIGLRAGILARGGLHAVLASVYPGSSWHGSTLQFPARKQRTIGLAGHGMTLMPSVLWRGRPLFSRHPDGSLLVIYSAATPLPLLAGDLGDGSLAALLGTTRAAILVLVAATPTTTELSQRTGISVSSASEHAKVLRDSGLITTTRTGKAVRHALTRLGGQLLAGRTASANAARREVAAGPGPLADVQLVAGPVRPASSPPRPVRADIALPAQRPTATRAARLQAGGPAARPSPP